MRLNAKMNAQAAKWAQHMASKGKLQHSTVEQRNGEGENIFSACGMALTGKYVTTEW